MNINRIQLLENYIKEEPENPFNYYALAMEYYEKEPPKAIDILSTLIKKQPEYLPSYYKLAHLYWDEESWDKAETVFIKGIELATKQEDLKAEKELKNAYSNFQFEID